MRTDTVTERILPSAPIEALSDYEATGGGEGLRAARRAGGDQVTATIIESGLRGRGGAGFPTGRKWQTVTGFAGDRPATVVVNGAEGEPGTFKDRALMLRNPFAVVEGALIAAHAVGADEVVVALKSSFTAQAARLRSAIDACTAAGWCDGVRVRVLDGPGEYLFGEETGLLEVIDGRPPFPRISPPYRQGVDEVGPEPSEPAGTVLASPASPGPAPTLADNVETLANVPGIVAHGADWFRSVGTTESPGTVICTISGDTAHAGVVELALGTPLAAAIERVGGGPARRGERLVAALPGVANAMIPAAAFDTPMTYEHFAGIGSGLGSAGFILFDAATDFVAVAAGVARFLAVESCGQCTPCKQDGLALADRLARVAASDATSDDLDEIAELVRTVATGARCNLATQQEVVIAGFLDRYAEQFRGHVDGSLAGVEPALVAPLVDIEDGVATLDESHAAKQPDWTFDAVDSGKVPVERLAAGGTEDSA